MLQYLYVDCNLFDVIDAMIQLLGPGGRALFGDILNLSKRRRFFASAQGVAFHRRAMQRQERPAVAFNQPAPGKIDDAVLAGLIARAQAAGCDAYLLPQGDGLPTANRRDDDPGSAACRSSRRSVWRTAVPLEAMTFSSRSATGN